MCITIAAIFQVGPNDVFLGEAEHAEPASTHGGVYGDPRISHQLRAFIKSHPVDNTAGVGFKPRSGGTTHQETGVLLLGHLCLCSGSSSVFLRPGLCFRLLSSPFPARLGDP